MKRKTFTPNLILLLFALSLLCGTQASAQNQEECFDFSGPAFLSGLWFADGETSFNATRTIDGERYHRARLWASGEYRLQLIEAFEEGIPGIRFFPDENSAQDQPKNMFFWVNSKGAFKDYNPEKTTNVVAAPAQFINTRSGKLSWMMGVIYGEGWRTGTIMDDAKSVGVERAEKGKELLESAGFRTVSIEEKSRKYRLYIGSSEFPKILALPFRRWTRVPGNDGNSEPPTNIEQYPSCAEQEEEEEDTMFDAKFDASRDNEPGTNVKISVLDNDILSDGSIATFDKINFDLNPDTPNLNTWAGTDSYVWRINDQGQLVFKPKNGFDGEPVSIKYKVIEVATGLSDVVYAKVTYDSSQSMLALEANPVSQGKQLQIILPEDSEITYFKVFDLSGKLVDEFTVSGAIGTLETAKLSRGNYIIQIFSEGKSEAMQFVID